MYVVGLKRDTPMLEVLKYGNNTLNRIENYGIMAMKEKIK